MTDIRELGTKIWAMANELRGTMDASEYKNYILGFMFYRYLSEHQETYMVENDYFSIDCGQTANDAYCAAAPEGSEEEADFAEALTAELGYMILPQYTWESLIAAIDSGGIKPSTFQEAFDSFEHYAKRGSAPTTKNGKETPKGDFRGVFADMALSNSRLGKDAVTRAKSLIKTMELVDEINYLDENGRDLLGAVYEYLIGQFAAKAGKKGGEFYTPHSVSQIIAGIVTQGRTAEHGTFRVLDPTCGSGSLLLTVRNALPGATDTSNSVKFYGQELNTTTYNLARMNLMMHGVDFESMRIRNADTLSEDWPDGIDNEGYDQPRSVDAVVANPPYSAHWDNSETRLRDKRFMDYGKLAPKTKADYAFLLHGLYHLDSEGTMAIVMPHGVLFRGAAEAVIRKALLDKNYLDAVIGLPANIFYGTTIPTVILVFKKNRSERSVLFIDASNEFDKGKNQNTLNESHIQKILDTYAARENVEKYAHLASREEIVENEYNLNIPRYVDTFEEEEAIDLVSVLRSLEEDDRTIADLESKIKEQIRSLGVEF